MCAHFQLLLHSMGMRPWYSRSQQIKRERPLFVSVPPTGAHCPPLLLELTLHFPYTHQHHTLHSRLGPTTLSQLPTMSNSASVYPLYAPSPIPDTSQFQPPPQFQTPPQFQPPPQFQTPPQFQPPPQFLPYPSSSHLITYHYKPVPLLIPGSAHGEGRKLPRGRGASG